MDPEDWGHSNSYLCRKYHETGRNYAGLRFTILTCTPSYAMYLAEVLEKQGVGPEKLNLKAGVLERRCGPRR